MGKLGWIIVLVLLFLLFHERIGATLDSVTRPPAHPGKWTTVAPPSTQTPTVPPRAESSAPAAVAEIKASQRRAALFTPWS